MSSERYLGAWCSLSDLRNTCPGAENNTSGATKGEKIGEPV